jgi:aspartate/methionine/tyrosine aminotransferase
MSSFHTDMTSIRLSPIVAISEQVRQRAPEFQKATGKEFILFQRGELDFPTPRYIVEAAKKALDAGHTKYPKSGGEAPLKQAILKKLASYNGAQGLEPKNIVCTYGGQEALELSFKLFSGTRGAGFAPCWSCVLENFVPFANIDFIEVPLAKDFSVNYRELEKVLKQVTFFYFNTPQNPTGKLFSEEETRTVVEMCKKYNVFVISDEAYERIVFDGRKHYSPLAVGTDNVIACYTFSKTYAMTGWRLGYIATRHPEIPNLISLGDYTQTAGVVTFLQYAAAEALDNEPEGERFVASATQEYVKRREALYTGLKGIAGIQVEKPQGAFYLFPNFTQLIPPDLTGEARNLFAWQRLMDKGVATVYGSCFGSHFTDNLRFSFSTTGVDKIQEGLSRIREAFS